LRILLGGIVLVPYTVEKAHLAMGHSRRSRRTILFCVFELKEGKRKDKQMNTLSAMQLRYRYVVVTVAGVLLFV
jgi:hypothetical protein